MSAGMGALLLALVVLGALAGLALPWYSARTLAAELQSLAAAHADGALRIRNLAHDAGWFSSRGAMDVEWLNQCSEDAADPVVVRVDYAASHVPGLRGLTRFEWSAAPAGAPGAPWQEMLRGGKLSGQGHVSFAGTLVSDMQLPELGLLARGESLQVAPSQGYLEISGRALRFDWVFDRMVARGNGRALEAKQISLHLDLSDCALGMGGVTLGLESLSTETVALQGLRLSSHTSQSDDRLDSKFTQSVKSLQFQGRSLNDLALVAEIKGLHTASLVAISRIVGETCAMRNATLGEQQQLRAAVKKLLLSGLSVGIPSLQGGGMEGSLEGDLLLTLAPSPGDDVLLATQLSSSGNITAKGRLMPPDQREYALSTGLVRELPDGVQASFDYGAGVLKVSGKTMDGAMVQLGLQKFDAWLKAFLSGQAEDAPVEEPPLVAPAEAPRS